MTVDVAALIGKQIGHFHIVEELGAGGMGVVYKARDTHLDRFVAVKVLPAHMVADPERRARFVREARTASALNHPNIIHVYDISSESGTDFIAMEYVSGRTLERLIPHNGMRLDDALKLGVQIADAMAAAHEAGIVHRDLKPSNVMVTEHGSVKVLDFGLAKLTDSGAMQRDALTRTMPIATVEGSIVGTLGYMSPEQAEGKPLDARSDIFSFGAMLYEMVSGRPAFSGDTPAALLASVIKDDPQPLRRRSADAPPELEHVIARCLHKDPEQRCQTMADVSAALTEIKSVGGSRAVYKRAQPAIRKRWRRFGWVALAVLALVVAGTWLASRYIRQGQLKSVLADKDVVVLAEFANSTGDAAFDVTLREALSNEIQNSNVLRPLNPTLMRVVLADMKRPPGTAITAAVAREVCVRAGEKATVEGSIAALGSSYVLTVKAVSCQTGDTLASQVAEVRSKEQVLRALGEAVRGVREKLGESLVRIQRTAALPATTTSFEAYQAYAAGVAAVSQAQWAAAIPHFVRATTIDPSFASAYQAQAIAQATLGENNRARELFRLGFENREHANERERLWIEARYYQEEGDFDKARRVFEQLVQLYPNHQLGVNSLANIHREFGDWEKALPPSREYIRLAPEMPIGYALLMATLIQLGRFDEARAVTDMPVPRRLKSADVQLGMLRIAYLTGDQAGAQSAIDQLEGTPLAIRSLAIQRAHAFSTGRFGRAEELQRQADEIGRRRTLTVGAAMLKLDGIVWKANAGLCREVEAAATPNLLSADVGRAPAAIAAVATCGGSVDRLLTAFKKNGKHGQLWTDAQLPLITARVLLVQGKPAEALAVLEPARAFERAVPGVILSRAEAYLGLGRPAEAATEFRTILNVRANQLRNDSNAAQVGLARALVAAGDTAGARKAYEAFLGLWKSADPDVPLLVAAKKEYAALRP